MEHRPPTDPNAPVACDGCGWFGTLASAGTSPYTLAVCPACDEPLRWDFRPREVTIDMPPGPQQ